MQRNFASKYCFFVPILVSCLCVLPVYGQSGAAQETPKQETISLSASNSAKFDWDGLRSTFANWHGKLHVVLVSQPGRRQVCKLVSINEDAMLCGKDDAHAKRYARSDVAAVLTPGDHTNMWPYFLGMLGAGAGILTAACFLASITIIGAIPLAVLGGLLVLASPLMGMMADDDVAEEVLYQRANTLLSVNPS